MSTKAPKVLARRANGAASEATGQRNAANKGKRAEQNDGSRPGRGRGQGGRKPDNAKGNDNETPKPPKNKPQNDGCKVVIRRLPPGMTQNECTSILGETWESGKGKVDWFSYMPGKITSDPSKPSRPSRAYLHLAKKDDAMALGEAVKTATWEDAKGSFTSPALVAPPALELSVYKKVPGNKKRTDARQGTIDQDPEFMSFLEELANPAPLRESIDVDGPEDANAQTKVTTTPLVEYLKEKKANKAKDSGKKKGDKGKAKDDDAPKKKGKESKSAKAEKGDKGDKADKSKESVKILTKKAATEQATEAAKNAAKEISAAVSQDAPKNRRAGIAAAARILQRDLGLSPGTAHRRARQDAAKAEADTKGTSAKDAPESPTESKDAPNQTPEASTQDNKTKEAAASNGKSQGAGRKARGAKNQEKAKPEPAPQPTASNPPVILKKKADTNNTPAPAAEAAQKAPTPKANQTEKPTGKEANKANSNKAASQKKPPAVSADATRAFIKQAVQSQGVTEAALRQALEAFGAITSIEMDKRKSFAYVEFAEHGGLVKAISASPVTVAQGSVQILERKDKKPAPAPNPPTAAGGAENDKSEKSEKKDKEKGKEKSSGRGRRGRGGKGNANANGQAAVTAEAPKPTAPSVPTESG